MINLPANQLGADEPLVPSVEKSLTTHRMLDTAITVSMFTTMPHEDISFDLEQGSTETIRMTRQMIEQMAPSLPDVIREGQDGGESPAEVANRVIDYENKRNDWFDVNGNIYLEQAIGINDPTINAEIIKFSTNLQIAQELFEQRLEQEQEDTGVIGNVTDFIDRYILRATAIGGWEQLTNRNERKGEELLNAAATMSPEDYKDFISSYITELGNEGFFLSDNLFAYQDGLSEFENKGEDPNEFFNRAFGFLDIVPVLALGGKAASMMRSTTTLARVGSMSGVEAAGDAGEALLRANANSPNPSVLTDMGPKALSPTPNIPVRPSIGRVTRMAEENKIVRGIRVLNEKNFLGQAVDGNVVQAATRRLVSTVEKSTNNPIVGIGDMVKMDDTGGFIFDVNLGTVKTGSPFKLETSAQRAVNKIREEFPTARVVPVDPTDSSKGFYINVKERLDLGKEAPELSTRSTLNPLKRLYASVFGSKSTIENESLNTLTIIAEGATSTIGKLVKPEIKNLDRLSVRSKDTLSKIYGDLRDGPDAYIRDSYSRAEFNDKWTTITGAKPTDADWAGFQSLRDINDASWLMRTHQRLQKYVSNGYYALTDADGIRLAGKVVDGVPRSELVTDVTKRMTVRVGDLRKSTKIWKLDRPLDNGNQYIVNPESVKVLGPEDVLGYNAGGRRINPNANYFVVAGTNKPRAFLAAFSETQARQATDAIKEVQAMMKELGPNPTNTSKLDEIVVRTNDWNPELQSFDDLQKFATDKGFDLKEDINFKVRDGEIQTGETVDEFSTTWGEYVTFGMKRQDDLLTEYGGKEAMQRDPVTAIFEDFSSISQQYTHNVVTQQAIEGWLKAARRKGSGWDIPATTDSRKAFMGAVRKENGNAAASELETQRNIINNRLRIKGEVQRRMEDFGAQARDYIFDSTGGRVKISNDFGLPAAANKMLALGFQSAFGFFNVSQLIVQGYHAPVIAAMAPKHGLRGLAMYPAVRLALMTDDIAVESLAVQRMAKAMGMQPEEAKELLDLIHTSGRNIINESAVENGTATQWGLSGWKGESALPSALRGARGKVSRAVRTGLDVGTIAFKEGDRIARITAMNTAYLEFKAANPGMSALSEYGMKWIRNREDALTLRMTNANRAAVQEGAMKLPTQWFSHSLRILENVVVGRDFTAGERARLLAMYIPMFGLTGFGAAKATDYIAEKLGAEPDGARYSLIKTGLIDAALSLIDVDIALGQRMSPITLFQQVYKDIVNGDATVLETALGPSGDIAFGFTEQIVRAVGDLYNGAPIAATNDVVRVLRQFSGIDNIYKAYGIMQNGVYRSRTGITLPFELNTADAIGQLLGFTPAEVNEWYQRKTWGLNRDTSVREFSRMMQVDWSQAMEAFNSNDDERGYKLLNEIAIRIQFSGMSEYDKNIVRDSLMRDTGDEVYRMIIDRMRREQTYTADTIEEQFYRSKQ